MNKYDCTNDVNMHKRFVKRYMDKVSLKLVYRSMEHDASKLEEPEKSMFDVYTPKLKELEFGSDEYKIALSEMGVALKHHYDNNRHHPEHFENCIDGMDLIDLVEMVSDWNAAAFLRQESPNLEYLAERFHLSGQLKNIIANTLKILDE
jgi:hypothetical protein